MSPVAPTAMDDAEAMARGQQPEARERTSDDIESANSETREIIQKHLLRLLQSRQYPKTICPSEVARALSKSELSTIGYADWRDLMPLLRSMLFDMRLEGELEVLQKGEVIPEATTLADIRGPIRARLVPTDG
ncbi:MAG: hypothetical protein Q9212_006169 [Teloschistes hypoglaucus]